MVNKLKGEMQNHVDNTQWMQNIIAIITYLQL